MKPSEFLVAHVAIAALGVLAVCAWASAQPVFTGMEIFPPEEFAARRAKVVERIGGAVAILQGATERPGEQPFRQNNQFFYLTGVVAARDDFRAFVKALGRDGRRIYTPLRAEVLGEASSSDAAALARATKQDPWDGRP